MNKNIYDYSEPQICLEGKMKNKEILLGGGVTTLSQTALFLQPQISLSHYGDILQGRH